MNKEKIKYFLYARKSSESEDRQVLSIEGQMQDNAHTIKRNNLNIIDTITDENSAAIPFNRPGYAEMIKRIKKGEASGIVVWNVDRLIRNPLEEGEFKWLLQTEVIKSIWTPSREYRSEDNGLLFSIEASMATQYSRDLSVKVKRGLRQKYDMGQPPGKAPIGYLNTKLSITGTNSIIVDPDRWHIIRKGFDLILSGVYSAPQIATILNGDYGLRTRTSAKMGGKPITRSTIYRIFTDSFYYGYFCRNGTLYKGSYKPMISVEEFDHIQRLLGRSGKARFQKHTFAFTGLITCGTCGSSITATKRTKRIKSTGEFKTYVFYHCTKRRKGCENCLERHYTKVEELEAMIIAELQQCDIQASFKDWAVNYFKQHYQEEIQKRQELAKSTLQQETKLLQELDNLIDLRISESISEEKYQEKKAEKEQFLIRIRAKKAALEKSGRDWIEIITHYLEFAVGAVEKFKNGDPLTQKKICFHLGSNWTLKEKKLLINKYAWLKPIENMKNIYTSHSDQSGPQKTIEEYDRIADLGLFNPDLLALRNFVSTTPP